jgi:altronate hydrolase
MSNSPILQIDKRDNLIVALQPLSKGDEHTIRDKTVVIRQDIPAKHKFSLNDLEPGDQAFMYGVIVGKATAPIRTGELVTTGNLLHATTSLSQARGTYHWSKPEPFVSQKDQFMGYRRPDGRCGTANYWIFVPLVFCSNQELLHLKDILPRILGYKKPSRYEEFTSSLVEQIRSGSSPSPQPILTGFPSSSPSPLFPNIDGVKFLTHHLGCGGTRSDAQDLCSLLAGYITHPNVAGATVISLGCQNAEISLLKQELNKKDPHCQKPILFFDRQSWNEPVDMTEVMIQQTLHEMAQANKAVRTPVPVSELSIGVECGGSDGFSGISANPVIGRTIDHLVAAGGSGILAEFPELCGVENELINRCCSDEKSERFIRLLSSYRAQAQHFGVDFDMNPSPGNIRDGLITDAMKSAGAAKKGGTSPIIDVLDYPEKLEKKGLNLLCTPGGDVESTTALAGAGANLIIFSTGLGTPTGNAIVPVIKVSSNSAIARRLSYMIDFDTGPVITGDRSISSLSEDLFDLCVKTANGSYTTCADKLGQDDFIPWKRQVSL